ncbi:unnamed protein product, partial [Discosporangium mesarthrocarpum]
VNLKKNTSRFSFTPQKKKAIIYISSSKRNLFCSLVDPISSKVLTSWSLASLEDGRFKKSLILGSTHLGHLVSEKAQKLGFSLISVKSRGLGKGISLFIRSLFKSSLIMSSIQDNTESSHNGCRPPKVRRKKKGIRIRI